MTDAKHRLRMIVSRLPYCAFELAQGIIGTGVVLMLAVIVGGIYGGEIAF